MNQVRDLLECAWPAVLGASGSSFRSATWCTAVAVTLNRCAGDLARVRRLGPSRFEAVVRRGLPRWGATRPLRIVRAVFAALGDGAGLIAHRPGALERAGLAMADWHDTRERLASAANWLRLRLARLARDRLKCDQSGHPAGPLGRSQPEVRLTL